MRCKPSSPKAIRQEMKGLRAGPLLLGSSVKQCCAGLRCDCLYGNNRPQEGLLAAACACMQSQEYWAKDGSVLEQRCPGQQRLCIKHGKTDDGPGHKAGYRIESQEKNLAGCGQIRPLRTIDCPQYVVLGGSPLSVRPKHQKLEQIQYLFKGQAANTAKGNSI